MTDRPRPGLRTEPRTERRGVSESTIRLGVIGLMVGSLFVAMFVRLWYLQVLDAPRFQAAASSNQIRKVAVPAPRGFVLDRNGQLLVGNQTMITVTLARPATATAAVAQQPVIQRLSQLLGVSPSSIQTQLNNDQYSPYEPVPVAVNVDMSKVVYIEEHKADFPGVSVEQQSERGYPQGDLGAQALGYDTHIDRQELAKLKSQGYQQGDLIGASGVESAYEQYLRGTPGVTDLSVNARGTVTGVVGKQQPAPGDDVQLTLDAGLQREVQNDLTKEIHTLQGTYDPKAGVRYPAPRGSAIVLDPDNGDVLAMASYPSYDPSVWGDGSISEADYNALTAPSAQGPLVNWAIQGLYTPGSTFKLVTATAALDSGFLSPSTIIDDPGSFTIPACSGQCTFHNAPGDGALGHLNVSEALTASDDVFFYTVGYDLWQDRSKYGNEPIQETAKLYGLGQPLHFPLGGDNPLSRVDSYEERVRLYQQAPKVYGPPFWNGTENLELAFGQGETFVSPLQLASAYAAFANGGTLYQPQIAARVLDHAGHTVATIQPKVIDHVPLPPATRNAILNGLVGAVTKPDGTAAGTFAGFPFGQMSVAGKTGTATTPTVEPTALFVAFAPVNHPKYVVMVVIEQAGFGASGSAPVARQVLQYLIGHPVGGVQQPAADPGVAPPPPSPDASTTTSSTAAASRH